MKNIFKQVILRYRYNKLKDLAASVFKESLREENIYYNLQEAAKMIERAADKYKWLKENNKI